MPDSLSAAASTAAPEIIARRDQLLAARAQARAQRQEVLMRLRRIERDLADCRAAARFFGLEIEFPPDEDEDAQRARIILDPEHAARAALLARHRAEQAAIEAKREAQLIAERARTRADEAKTKARSDHHLEAEPGQYHIKPPVVSMGSTQTRSPRQTIREVVLNRLKAAGDRGLKAAPIREWIETSFGVQIHEKTVGMTLYRLQNDGLVRHEGHTWFLAPPKAETGNPGADTPGPINPPT